MKNIMKKSLSTLLIAGSIIMHANDDFKIKEAKVEYIKALDLLVFSQKVAGKAGNTTPDLYGALNGASVLVYVFQTSLKSTDVGFNATQGIVALALTSHPDFDDTPLCDENNDKNFKNDGKVWHPHWVVLVEDKSLEGGLKVKEFKKADKEVILPPTNPGMPMYMDSPGFSVVIQNDTIKALVPANRVNNKIDFSYDAVSVLMKVNTSKEVALLGVYKVYSVLDGALNLKNKVTNVK